MSQTRLSFLLLALSSCFAAGVHSRYYRNCTDPADAVVEDGEEFASGGEEFASGGEKVAETKACGDILVSDRLRKLMLDESSEEWELYSEAERKELIFHVMKRLAIGGGMNQYDNKMQPYLDLTKKLYKDLVTVSKAPNGALQVSSLTYEIEGVSGSSANLWPRQNDHNFCYVAVDPLARHVKLWYCAWFPMM